MASGALVLLAVGWVSGYDEITALGTAAAAVFVFALGWAGYRPQIVIERRIDPDRVEVGERATGLITVTNQARRPCPRLVAEDQYTGGVIEVALPRLAAGDSKATAYDLPTGRRGVLQIGPMVLRRADPFGLVSTTKHYGELDTLWVHPRTHAVGPVPTGRSRDLDGPTSDTAPQGGMAFHTLREYVRGDDRRHIHWRSTARTGTLMVRHMVDSSHPVTTIVVDTRRAHYSGDAFEHAVEAAASVTLASVRNRFPVRLLTTDGLDLGARGRTPQATEVLDALAGISLSDQPNLIDVAQRAIASSAGGSVVVLTGAPDVGDSAVIARMRAAFDYMVALRFHDGDERSGTAPIPGATVIDATSPESFVHSWQRLGRA